MIILSCGFCFRFESSPSTNMTRMLDLIWVFGKSTRATCSDYQGALAFLANPSNEFEVVIDETVRQWSGSLKVGFVRATEQYPDPGQWYRGDDARRECRVQSFSISDSDSVTRVGIVVRVVCVSPSRQSNSRGSGQRNSQRRDRGQRNSQRRELGFGRTEPAPPSVMQVFVDGRQVSSEPFEGPSAMGAGELYGFVSVFGRTVQVSLTTNSSCFESQTPGGYVHRV
jgi:hypothetical protein